MSVPTHNLYDFIHQVLEREYVLWYFYPFGSKNITDLILHNTQKKPMWKGELQYDFSKQIICHDQEPLNFAFARHKAEVWLSDQPNDWKKKLTSEYNNLDVKINNFNKHTLLLHSELNSIEVVKYEKTTRFKCAYWWSHAILSRDWYRFAQYDTRLNTDQKKVSKLFLIYAQGKTGSRLYRGTFLYNIQKTKIANDCQIGSVRDIDINPDLSAEYHVDDMNATGISVILETVFDHRIHLTEKTCRALACGHPFIIANGPGTLKYLQSHGFKTYSGLIDETYDTIANSDDRMSAIISEMTRLANLPYQQKLSLLTQCQEIANYNRQWFFSCNFFDSVINELKTNILSAYVQTANEINIKKLLHARQQSKNHNPKIYKSTEEKNIQRFIVYLIKHCRKGGTLEDYVPPDFD